MTDRTVNNHVKTVIVALFAYTHHAFASSSALLWAHDTLERKSLAVQRSYMHSWPQDRQLFLQTTLACIQTCLRIPAASASYTVCVSVALSAAQDSVLMKLFSCSARWRNVLRC
jgi:hypothetical protein